MLLLRVVVGGRWVGKAVLQPPLISHQRFSIFLFFFDRFFFYKKNFAVSCQISHQCIAFQISDQNECVLVI